MCLCFQKKSTLHNVGRLVSSGTPYCSLGDHGATRATPHPRDQLWDPTLQLSTKLCHTHLPQLHLTGKTSWNVASPLLFPSSDSFSSSPLVLMFSKCERWPDVCQRLMGPRWRRGRSAQHRARDECTEEVEVLSLSFVSKLGLGL